MWTKIRDVYWIFPHGHLHPICMLQHDCCRVCRCFPAVPRRPLHPRRHRPHRRMWTRHTSHRISARLIRILLLLMLSYTRAPHPLSHYRRQVVRKFHTRIKASVSAMQCSHRPRMHSHNPIQSMPPHTRHCHLMRPSLCRHHHRRYQRR